MTGLSLIDRTAAQKAEQSTVRQLRWRCATRRLGLRAAGVAAVGALVVFVATHEVPQPGPAPERAWALLAATCTTAAAAAYRGVVPSVRLIEPGRYLITAQPSIPSPALTVRYGRHRGFGYASDSLRPATRADRALLSEFGCAPVLGWSAQPPG